MQINTIKENNINIAIVNSKDILIRDVQSALDFIANTDYQTGCDHIVIYKEALSEDFFDLSTKVAGEILQKFTNYRKKIAIVGDFSKYTSKSLKDFIFECNNGSNIFFLSDEEEAIKKLSNL